MPTYSTTQDFIKAQLRNLRDVTDANKVLRYAAISAAPAIQNRVQQKGQKSDGSQIGKYGGRVIKSAFGKAQTFASKRRLKTVTAMDPYKVLRMKLGLQVQYIDFTFSGDMFKSWRPVPMSKTAFGVTFVSSKELEKARRLEQKFGITFDLSNSELSTSLEIINRKAQEFLSR